MLQAITIRATAQSLKFLFLIMPARPSRRVALSLSGVSSCFKSETAGASTCSRPPQCGKWPLDETRWLTSVRARRIPWRSLLVLAACALVIWLVHPAVLSSVLRLTLDRAAREAGLQLEVGGDSALTFRSRLSLNGCAFAPRMPTNLKRPWTLLASNCRQVPLWSILFDGGRFFRAVIIQDVRAVLDLRRGDNPPGKPAAQANEREERTPARAYAALATRVCGCPARKSRVPRSRPILLFRRCLGGL